MSNIARCVWNRMDWSRINIEIININDAAALPLEFDALFFAMSRPFRKQFELIELKKMEKNHSLDEKMSN